MKQKIHILSDQMMKRIAAGEVVERPASVVKELMENSIDAGASNIDLLVKDAGSTLIKVVDDGEGMTENDARICCERHATSKIEQPQDLDSIATLGFRGEALASISSISQLTIETCTPEASETVQVLFQNGEINHVAKSAPRPGTVISVQNLFYNVPARKKFLKTPATELRQIVLAFKRIALAHPHIHFALHINNEKTMDFSKGTQEERIRDIVGPDKSVQLVSFEKEAATLSLFGYISRPGDFKRTRDEQYIFLNRRYIVNRSITHAILTAYGPRLDKMEFPAYAIFIALDPKYVDVNVHPTKIEVRFSDEKFIHDILHRAVKEAMATSRIIPDMNLIPGGNRNSFKSVPRRNEENEEQLSLEVQRPLFIEPGHSMKPVHEINQTFWQLHHKYILTQIKSGLTLIDQHAAHERILFERAMQARNHTSGLSQQMLFPQTVDLSVDYFMILTEMIPCLEKIGFGIREFGNQTVIIESVPPEVKPGTERELLMHMIDYYRETQQNYPDLWHAVAATFACKAAIKTGDPLTESEMASLVDRLFATEEPYFCPHGRPVVVNLTIEEIDRRFKR